MSAFKISYTINGSARAKTVECESDGEAWEIADNILDHHDDAEIISVIEVQ